MAGKRLLDTAALLEASRSVAAKHFSIRRTQFDLYSRTSSLARAVKSQTNQAAQTAYVSVQRFSQDAQSSFQSTQQDAASSSSPDQVPSTESVKGTGAEEGTRRGVKQDHFYERSTDHSVTDTVPEGELEVDQKTEKTRPLPDGTIPPENSSLGSDEQTTPDGETVNQRSKVESPKNPLQEMPEQGESIQPTSSTTSNILDPAEDKHTLLPEEAKKAQRQSEFQIPSKPAEPPTGGTSDLEAVAVGDKPEFSIDQEQDVFYQPPGTNSPVLSALPRVKVPKVEWDEQGGDKHIPQEINSDVYYSSEKGAGNEAQSTAQTSTAQDEPSEEMIEGLFHNPRIAKMLGGKRKYSTTSYRSKAAVAGDEAGHGKLGEAQNQESSTVLRAQAAEERGSKESILKLAADISKDAASSQDDVASLGSQAAKSPYEMRESRVPSSQFGRLWQYGGLAASMTFGAVGEGLRRASGSGAGQDSSRLLSAGNMDRLVAKLSKMRGAALKLGQMMSFQDSKMLPKPIHEVLQRVQDSADYMPASQRNAVLAADLGSDWADLFESFEEKPMAAASIGQVHGAVLKSTGRRVAVKVQYPGVATSVSSDLNNLSLLLTATRLLPKGLYLDKTIANARTELAWECDYLREAECAKRFKSLLSDETDVFIVPDIVEEACGKQVLTMERMEGVAVTKIQNFTQEQRDWIGTQILRLCLREIIDFKYMQTDPNWTNFLYNPDTSKLELLDFGASRDFPGKFVSLYVQNLAAASRKDRNACRDLSIQLGYLTGYESQAMLKAHIESVMTLAEPFMDFAPDVYDFRDQTITDRIRSLIPVMLRERLAPPPEETYSLHRKLSGAFLLCARLGSRVRCKEMFKQGLARMGL